MTNVKGQDFEFSNGYTYLMLKAEEGNIEEVNNILSDLQQTNINAVNRNGSTALSLAAKNGFYRIAEALVSSGADVNVKNSSGQSPLFLACWNNYRDIAKLLVDNRAEIDTKDQRGWTSLMIAAYNSHKEIVKLLLDRGADVSIKDCFDKTALDRTKDPQVAKMLQDAGKEALQESRAKEEDERSRQEIQSSPDQIGSRDQQLQSILKKASPKRDNDYSKFEEEDRIKVHEFNSQPNYTTASSYRQNETLSAHGHRSNDRRGPSVGRNEVLTPHNDSRLSRDYASLDARKTSNPNVSTRLSRPRHERNNYSMDRSYQLSSRSPGRSTILSARGKGTPLRSRDPKDIRNVTSPLSEAKRQSLKEDIQNDLTTEVNSVSGKIKDIILQKIALEVPQHMQSFEQNLGKELNSAFQFKMDNVFKSLHASFNLKVKFCLNKLGFDTAGLNLAPFSDEDVLYNLGQKPFTAQVPKYNYEKEAKAIEKDISRLEKSVTSKSFLAMDRSTHSDFGAGGHHHNHDCVHTSFAARTQIKTELAEQLGQDVRSTTEYLMEYSNGKINEVVRTETSQVHQKMLGELTRSLDTVEEDFRRKFEDFINKKVNELAATLTGSTHHLLVSSKKITPEVTPSKQLFSSKTSEKKITFSQDIDRPLQQEIKASTGDLARTLLKSPESQYSQKLSASGYKERDFVQTRGKIEKLKNSLNFIDDMAPSFGEKSDESYRDNQKEVRRELHYHQLEAGDSSLRDSTQSNQIKSSMFSERPELVESTKKEYNDPANAASKLEEIRNYYQKKYGHLPLATAGLASNNNPR